MKKLILGMTFTYNQMPYKNNYNANTRPQTNNQKILSNGFMKHYRGK